MIRVLIVEDDEIIAEELSEVFGQWGFDATAVLTVGKFWEVITELQPQVVVVDLTLPDGSGADIIRDIRSQSDIGIIVISGRSDTLLGPDFGWDCPLFLPQTASFKGR